MSKVPNGKCSADVIIAALNEEEGISLTLTKVPQKTSPNQVLVVDSQSIDRRVEIVKDLGVRIFVSGWLRQR